MKKAVSGSNLTRDLLSPHIDSFNYFLDEGVHDAFKAVDEKFAAPNGDRIVMKFQNAEIGVPTVSCGENTSNIKIYPAECRQRATTYKAKLTATLQIYVNDRLCHSADRVLGELPIMVMSNRCNISKLSSSELVKRGEEAGESGGYFIARGLEKIIRMLLVIRRNYPLALVRPRWKTRGELFTEFGISMRSVRSNCAASVMTLHYLSNGSAKLQIVFRKEQFYIPLVLMLKALVVCTDHFIFTELIRGFDDDEFLKGCAEEGYINQAAILQFLGSSFRVVLNIPLWVTDVDAGRYLIEQCVCIHLNDNRDKFNILVYMCQKLFALVKGKCKPESADNPMFQEVSLPGHLYTMILKERLETYLQHIRRKIDNDLKNSGASGLSAKALTNAFNVPSAIISRAFEYFLATGNLISQSGLGLQQASGMTIIAEKLNYLRYMSHFRSIHRGAYFAQMRTTTVRKLLPEAWGFICPVHTPDGSPCGLLNHLAANCRVVAQSPKTDDVVQLLRSLGMIAVNEAGIDRCLCEQCYTVFMDGSVLGYIHRSAAASIATSLRSWKVSFTAAKVSLLTEICLVTDTGFCALYPGLYIFTTPARMMRPVSNLLFDKIEFIGTFEQVYLGICINSDEVTDSSFTHQELAPTAMLSFIANLTPFSDFNQSPRNMYQCQMGKQTMGTPLHSLLYRCDNKLYRIQTPQSPLVRPDAYVKYQIDEYPLGTNAVVAVISYTGYDMEDAMIINKSSYERGFAHGQVYKSERIDLAKLNDDRSRSLRFLFFRNPNDSCLSKFLDNDGLPYIGQFLQENDPYYCYVNVETGAFSVKRFSHSEPAYVENIKILGDDNDSLGLSSICITLRIRRNPTIGDKFASRHGQKGICSFLWPNENMPFTESGFTPDIIFNPHGFPSRMTIGMMIESMAGKSASSHGITHDASPFQFSEKQTAIHYFGELLSKAGFNYFGNERMYSGVDGREFQVDIFIGIVYYQRLRHMVSDKYQVRTTGPVDQLTRQPIHGRKRGGGIRFGEMERDSLLAHGSAFLIQDRLFNCSDKDSAYVCTKCGSLISTSYAKPDKSQFVNAEVCDLRKRWTCRVCATSSYVELVPIPYVFRYLVAELAAVNIKTFLEVK